ncbi:uncharacterized protein LOC119602188 isoform X2 [Lucilia sericata]|uniref:uncharacterized protein LOC119602188 isoform X2 n=1 Tax=Lucilia sericata TaxID=13632 RepID=UPI0018A87C88|nr:uncharacterized protein LOC119602188 isoform X2 [Lucilia sericata]
MWRFILISTCVLWGVMNSEAASRNMKKRGVGSYAGSYSNSNGENNGYVGNYNDYDDFNYAPDFGFGFLDPYAFHQQLTAQILAQQAATQNQIRRQQAAFFDNIRHQNHYSYKGGKGNRYAPNYSAAAASIGPGGGYQTAFISPENPAIPNVSNRFGSTSPGGYKGVSVSSYSSSSDINGKKTSNRGSQTTINDNGRITTYKVHS